MICYRCGKKTNIRFKTSDYELCQKCAKLLYTLLESKTLVGSLAIASLPLSERARLRRERAEEYARGEVA